MGSAFTIRLPFVRTRSTDGRGAWAGSSSGCREAALCPALRIEAFTEVCVTVDRVYGDCSAITDMSELFFHLCGFYNLCGF